jgi:hypothetical protein
LRRSTKRLLRRVRPVSSWRECISQHRSLLHCCTGRSPWTSARSLKTQNQLHHFHGNRSHFDVLAHTTKNDVLFAVRVPWDPSIPVSVTPVGTHPADSPLTRLAWVPPHAKQICQPPPRPSCNVDVHGSPHTPSAAQPLSMPWRPTVPCENTFEAQPTLSPGTSTTPIGQLEP